MSGTLDISNVQIRLVENGTDGLLAWVSCVVANAVKLDNLAVRRGRDGALFLTYPAKKSSDGSTHQIYHPISSDASRAIQDAVLTRLASLAMAAADDGTQAP